MQTLYIAFKRETFNETALKQKYLEKYNNEKSIQFENKILSEDKINELITNNPFGFLPSNISQFLYLINFIDLSKIFEIQNIKNIKANFNDNEGSIEIFILQKIIKILKLFLIRKTQMKKSKRTVITINIY